MLRDYVAAVLRDRPVLFAPLWHPSGGAARDLTGRNVDGSTTGTMTNAAGPMGGLAIKFPGTVNNRISFPDAAHLDLGDVWTVEGWIFVVAGGDPSHAIGSKGDTAYALQCELAGNFWARTDRPGVTTICRSGGNTVPEGRWAYLVATKAGSAARTYVDGKDHTVAVNTSTCANNAEAFSIGASPQGGGNFNNDSASRTFCVAAYNYALSPAQVLRHYTAFRFGRLR